MNYDGKRKDLQSFSSKLAPEDSPSSLNLDGTITNRSDPEEVERRKSPGESPNKISSSNEPRRLTVSIFEATNLELKLKLRNTSLKPEKKSTRAEEGSYSSGNNSSSIQQDDDVLIPSQNIPTDDPATTPVAKTSIGSENDSKAEGANHPRLSAVQHGPSPRSSLPQRVSQISNHSKPSVPNFKHIANSLDESGYVLRLPTVQRNQSLITENNRSSSTASDETHAIVDKKQSSTEPAGDEAGQTKEIQLEESATDVAIIGKNELSTESAGDDSVKPLKNQREERASDVVIAGKNKLSTESAGDKEVEALEKQPEERFTEVAIESGIRIPKPASLTPPDNPRLSTISNTDSDTTVVGNNPAFPHRASANTTSTLLHTENRNLELLESPDMATSKPLNHSESRPFKSQTGSKVECDCSSCECELPIPPARNEKPKPVPPGFSKYECDCSPCECTSFGPSQPPSAEIIDSNLALQECHCSPCECTLPSTGALRKTITKPVAHEIDHTECNCSPCECSYPPSSIVSEAGIVRAPSPIPAACQVRPSNFCNAPCSQMPTPMLRMQSEQVSAAPMLQSDQCQTYQPQFPYQTFQQQRPNNLPSYCFLSQFPNQQFLPNCQNPFPQQGHFQLDNGAPPLVCPPEGSNNAQWLLPKNFNTSGQFNGVYSTPVGFMENQCTQPTTSPPVAYRNSWVNRIPFAPKPDDHRASFMLTANANHFGNMNPLKMNAELRDCSEQTECGKDASSYCSSTRRRKSSAVKGVANFCQDTQSPQLVLVREVYHFKKTSKAQCCGSRKTLSNATSSLCCRPRWTNAYKYQCNPYVSKVRPPRPSTLAPCPVCKGCDCICNDDQQSSSCSHTSSKHHQPSRSCLNNGCCEKVAKKASCGCELVKVPKGPVSLVREFLVQGNGLPLHLQGLCGVQQSPPSLQQQQQPVTEVKGQSPANNSTIGQTSKGNERKSNALLTVSRVPVVVEEDLKRMTHGSVSRRASQRRSTVQRKKSVSNSKDSASVENKANNNQISSENNDENVDKVEHETQNVMEINREDVTETEKEPKADVVAGEDTHDEGTHKKRRKRKGDKGDDDEPDGPTPKPTSDDHADELDDTPWRSNDLDQFQEPEAELDDEPPIDQVDNVSSQFFDT